MKKFKVDVEVPAGAIVSIVVEASSSKEAKDQAKDRFPHGFIIYVEPATFGVW